MLTVKEFGDNLAQKGIPVSDPLHSILTSTYEASYLANEAWQKGITLIDPQVELSLVTRLTKTIEDKVNSNAHQNTWYYRFLLIACFLGGMVLMGWIKR